MDQPTTTDIGKLHAVPIPPPSVVKTLVEQCSSFLQKGVKSLTCPHAPGCPGTYLPIWTLSYWCEVVELQHKYLVPWLHAEETLQKHSRKWRQTENQTHELIEGVYNALGSISWFGNVKGFENSEPIWNLARYATDQWLSDVHQNQMTDLLCHDLRFHQASWLIEVEHTYFFKTLKLAHESHNTGEYEMSKYFARTRKIGMALASGMRKSLGFLLHVNNNHWIAIVLDFAHSQILIGDSLKHDPNSALLDILSWWTHHHTSRTFTTALLPTTVQHDTFSCGVLAFNALAHYVLPEKYNLIDSNAVRDERLRVLLEVIKRHSDQVSCSLHSEFNT